MLGRARGLPEDWEWYKLKIGLLLANVVLGIPVLLLGGFSVAPGAVPPP